MRRLHGCGYTQHPSDTVRRYSHHDIDCIVMVLNVLDPAQTRYIVRGEELEAHLKEKYGKEYPDFDFSVEASAQS
jgi:hypothetical protein